MEIYNIDLSKTTLATCQEVVNKCEEIINENLQVNGGTLKQVDIFKRDFEWTNLIIAIINDEIVGFSLIRLSQNTHDLRDSNNYYYLSDVVVKNKYKKQGIGTSLIEVVIDCTKGMPLVASVLKGNQASIKLLSKFMTCYGNGKNGKYLRFVDNESYNKLYGVGLPSMEFPDELGGRKSNI